MGIEPRSVHHWKEEEKFAWGTTVHPFPLPIFSPANDDPSGIRVSFNVGAQAQPGTQSRAFAPSIHDSSLNNQKAWGKSEDIER